MKKIFFFSFLCAIAFSACDGTDNTDPVEDVFKGVKFEQTGILSLSMNHKFNEEALELGKNYVTAQSDTVKFDKLRYYLTNISLQDVSGKWFNLGNYHLLDLDVPTKHKITLNNVPAGNYVKMSFLIGVDSVANFSGAQTGELDPSYGMYWTWATGYIFFRLNGRYNGNNPLSFDLGGNNNLPKIEFDLSTFKIKGNNLTVNTEFNLASIFHSPHDYKLTRENDDMHSATYPGAPLLKDNIKMGCFNITTIK
ncbi:MAG: hypothetical protein EAY81_05510 [Bacteroidetes bacterium]|nr:MAG: hypothetical protein EAY81_05510 [Bacteroidota bacterium]